MSNRSRQSPAPLALVSTEDSASEVRRRPAPASDASSAVYELDWSILMARAQDGDGEAYRRLLSSIVPYIRTLVLREQRGIHDIEDVVQDVLLTVHAVRHTYDPNRPFGPWLRAIAQRRIVDRYRRERQHRDHEIPLDERETFSTPAPSLMDRAWSSRKLSEAVERLPPRQREAVRLLKLRELSLKEASAMTGSSVPALKVSVHRAVKTLRRLLVHDEDRK